MTNNVGPVSYQDPCFQPPEPPPEKDWQVQLNVCVCASTREEVDDQIKSAMEYFDYEYDPPEIREAD